MNDKIELLSEALIDEHSDLALEVLATSSRLARPLGWHYVLDLVWILSQLRLAPGATVLDAGAGYGILQYMLADRGLRVISADRGARSPPADLSRLYDFQLQTSAAAHRKVGWRDRLSPYLDMRLRDLLAGLSRRRTAAPPTDGEAAPGQIVFYQCDLTDMPELADGSIDAVVSVSALEHNEPAKLPAVVSEISRVARSGAPCLYTVSATRRGSVFHPPSSSWLLDEAGLAAAYGLHQPESNFARYDELSAALEGSRYLERWLDLGYFRTGDNGMPWGVWDPRYMPVGIRKRNQRPKKLKPAA